jgi:hypothetical protein
VSKLYFFAVLLLTGTIAGAQKLKKEDRELMSALEQHVRVLSNDELGGRRTGTKGEKLAAEYIATVFRKTGLFPKGTQEYLQPFTINEGKQVNQATHLVINGENLQLNRDFFPLPFSPNVSLEALPSIALQEADMPWFFDLKELIEENKANPHFDLYDAIRRKAENLKNKGATTLFVYNTGKEQDGIRFNSADRSAPAPIPVVYISQAAAKKFLADESATLDMKLKVDMGEKIRTGTNVIGFIDNGAPTTVVLGAHFDHLGLGEDGNSLVRTGQPQIHNGADDNASGVAALLELARMLKSSKLTANNYLLAAFSGEELGLLGSKYFVEHPVVDPKSLNYMINMDMIGRLNDSSKTLTVGGYGTSPEWGKLFSQTGKKGIYTGNLVFRFDSSGTGPSDHASFYRKDIPVLFYFTGLHSDYHKPSDDVEKLNYAGQMQIVRHIYSLLELQGKARTKLQFTKTREMQMGASAAFSVTMGIMPDYSFSGAGLRVDGVSDNRPAQKAGLKTGDVITALGDHNVSSVETYMEALGKYKKGDKVKVSYRRGTEPRFTTVEF